MNNNKPLVLRWNKLLLNAIACTVTSPPLTARALAMLHTAMYDAWSVYDKCAISTTTARLIKDLGNEQEKPANEDRSMSYAAYRVCSHLFCGLLPAENRNMFRDFMCSLGYNPDDQSLDVCTATGVGNLSGRMQVEYRLGDGSNPVGSLHMPPWSDYTGYVAVNTPDQVKELDHWQPLRVEVAKGEYKVQKFLVPQWSLVRSFALQKPNQFRPDEPYWKDQSEFHGQAEKILHVSASLTDEHKVIAEYWADGPGTYTPPGHWAEIAEYVCDSKDYVTARCIKIFFALSNAMLDSSIACWDSKRRYDYVRPVTAVRELFRGKDVKAWGGPHQGTQIIKGETWQPYIATPPFPEHVSGHSVFSAAAATILKCFAGDSFNGCIVINKGESKIEPGTTPAKDITLNWPGFTDAADQAGLSRIFGGIHFERAVILGRELGICVGNNTWERAKYYFNDR